MSDPCATNPRSAATSAELADTLVILKALADPQRLRILDRLLQGDSCNCELHDCLGLPPNLLSHHLKVLRKAGLITSRADMVDARWIYYAVNKNAINGWRGWLGLFLDTSRLQERQVLCGPEGRCAALKLPLEKSAEETP